MRRFRLYKRLVIVILAFLGLFSLFKDSFIQINDEDFYVQEDEDLKVYFVPDIIAPNNNFINNINSARINRLFRKIQEKEKSLRPIIDELKLISFEDLANRNGSGEYELLQVVNGHVEATEKLVRFLIEQSNLHSFEHPRTNVDPSKITIPEEKPVIVTAANSMYYDHLQATVFKVHKYFPDFHLIVYDLGLQPDQLKMTKEKCKCEVRRFDPNSKYSLITKHVTYLKNFSWKPIVIQEVLNDYDTVIYIDCSIRFKSNEIKPIVDSVRKFGLLTQYIYLRLLRYTNPKMFTWFEESPHTFEKFFTAEAGIVFVHNNFLSRLIMKAWVTCALDESCIAPRSEHMHRFDQDALTIICSYFVGHPKEVNGHLPAYSFTKEESYFFEIKRNHRMRYFYATLP